MAQFVLERLLCLNGRPVPLVQSEAIVQDGAGPRIEKEEIVIPELKSHSPMVWLENLFGLRHYWWKHHHNNVPLVLEMKQAILLHKVRKPGTAFTREPRHPDDAVPISVRGRGILTLNHMMHLSLVCRPGGEVDTVQWFLEELTKDFDSQPDLKLCHRPDLDDPGAGDHSASLAASPVPPGASAKKRKCLQNAEEQEMVDEVLGTLRAHPRCSQAFFLPSRNAIRLQQTGRPHLEVNVPRRTKLLKGAVGRADEASWSDLRSSYELSLATALKSLEFEPDE